MPARLSVPLRVTRAARVALALPAILAVALALAAPAAGPPSPPGLETPGTAAAPLRYDLSDELFHPVHARHGMVASDSRLASEVGLRVLREGGNAVDAAVAMGFALAVTLPQAGNLGGGGFMLVHDPASGRDIALDFREAAPARASRDMFLDARGEVVPGRSLFTPLAIGVPGTVAGLLYALEHYGSLPRQRLLAPAVALARQGFQVGEPLAEALAADEEHLGAWDSTRRIFFRDGRPLQAGQTLRNPDLAASLERIAREGARAFYDGPLGAAIVADIRARGGLLEAEDLRAYRVVERAPVRGRYRGYDIVSMPPPSSGGVHVVQILQMLEHFPLADWGPGSARTIHVLAESMKRAYADRSEYLGDPDVGAVLVRGLTSPAYAAELARGIDLAHATPSQDIRPGHPQPYESDQTTQFTVADGRGGLVSTTYTLNTSFGSGLVAAGTGILLNNEMDDFSARPGVPNAYGLVGGAANAVAPRKRPLSSMAPTLVFKDGKPWAATGSPGGARIISTTVQTLVDLIDFGLNPAEAAAAVRVHHQWLPDELRVEKGLSPDTLALLRALGHPVHQLPAMGRTQTLRITPEGIYGASDPRGPDGAALGF